MTALIFRETGEPRSVFADHDPNPEGFLYPWAFFGTNREAEF
jgi:hypothetical protein